MNVFLRAVGSVHVAPHARKPQVNEYVSTVPRKHAEEAGNAEEGEPADQTLADRRRIVSNVGNLTGARRSGASGTPGSTLRGHDPQGTVGRLWFRRRLQEAGPIQGLVALQFGRVAGVGLRGCGSAGPSSVKRERIWLTMRQAVL